MLTFALVLIFIIIAIIAWVAVTELTQKDKQIDTLSAKNQELTALCRMHGLLIPTDKFAASAIMADKITAPLVTHPGRKVAGPDDETVWMVPTHTYRENWSTHKCEICGRDRDAMCHAGARPVEG